MPSIIVTRVEDGRVTKHLDVKANKEAKTAKAELAKVQEKYPDAFLADVPAGGPRYWKVSGTTITFDAAEKVAEDTAREEKLARAEKRAAIIDRLPDLVDKLVAKGVLSKEDLK